MTYVAFSTLCPACGFEQEPPPWQAWSPSNEICPSCGLQFGVQDQKAWGIRTDAFYHGWRTCWLTHGAPWSSVGMQPPAGWDAREQAKRVENPSNGPRLRRLGVIRFSAAQLLTDHAVTMSLDDGGGIGWVLVGELLVESVGRIAFESGWDPDYQATQVHGPADAPADAIERVLTALNLTSDDLLQVFD